MAHFDVLNPARKFRILSTLLYRVSKRFLTGNNPESTSILSSQSRNARTSFNLWTHSIVTGTLVRDPDYYRSEQDGGLCIFQVENTLFKVSVVSHLSI